MLVGQKIILATRVGTSKINAHKAELATCADWAAVETANHDSDRDPFDGEYQQERSGFRLPRVQARRRAGPMARGSRGRQNMLVWRKLAFVFAEAEGPELRCSEQQTQGSPR